MRVSIRNRQKRRAIDGRFLYALTKSILHQAAAAGSEIAVHLVEAREMTTLNQMYLGHEGSTDVITFDHQESPNRLGLPPKPLYGELFVCVDDAVQQARAHGTDWKSEIVRYVVHGILHLCGHDDLTPSDRRNMKRVENRMVSKLRFTVDLRKLGRKRQATT